MADNRGNSSSTNTNMPSGVTKTKSTDTQISNSVMTAISNVLGTPLKSIQSNTANNVKLTTQIKKELLGFSKDTKKIQENNKKDKKELLKFSDKETAVDKKENVKSDIKNLVKSGSKLFNNFTKNMKSVFDKNKDSLQGLLGPLNLILSPIQDFFGGGIFGKIFTTLGSGIKGIFGKFKKKNPNANDVAKSGAFGVGSLYVVEYLKKLFDKKKSNTENGIFDKLKGLFNGKGLLGLGGISGGALKTLGAKFATVAGPLAIVTAIITMVVDAIKGIFKSKEWGVSKISGGLGGLLGGTTQGLKGIVGNMGKWALLGFGIGLPIAPPIGAIVGTILGGAVGAIFNLIGGKNLAKGFDFIWKWFKSVFIPSFLEMLDDLFAITKFKEIFKSDNSIGKKIGKAIGLFFVTCFKMPIKLFTSTTSFFKKIINANNVQKALSNLTQSIFSGLSNAWASLKDFGSNVKNKAKEGWEKVKDFGSDVWEGIKESELMSFVSSLFNSLKDGITKFFKENPVGKWIDSYIINPIKTAFTQMGAWFSYIGDAFENDGIKGALNAMTFGMLKKDKETGLTDFEAYKQNLLNPIEVNDAIIRTDGSIIKTNPKDTLVALKDIPLSVNQVREETNKNINGSLSQIERNENLEKKLTTIIEVLSKILAKDLQVQLPPQTRSDLDLLMSGGLV